MTIIIKYMDLSGNLFHTLQQSYVPRFSHGNGTSGQEGDGAEKMGQKHTLSLSSPNEGIFVSMYLL
jgi:hypothetical protein